TTARRRPPTRGPARGRSRLPAVHSGEDARLIPPAAWRAARIARTNSGCVPAPPAVSCPGRCPMRRFTILSLMGLILVLALAIAALRNATDSWAGGMLLATPLLLSVALVGTSCGEGRSRARRLGFAA